MQELNQAIVFMLGVSFMLGSLTTIFLLLILDMVRALRIDESINVPDE